MHDGIPFPSRDDGLPCRVRSPPPQATATSQPRPPLRIDRHALLQVINALLAATIDLEDFVVVVEGEMRSFEGWVLKQVNLEEEE